MVKGGLKIYEVDEKRVEVDYSLGDGRKAVGKRWIKKYGKDVVEKVWKEVRE